MTDRLDKVDGRLARIEDEPMVTGTIRRRLEAREAEGHALLAMLERLERRS